jgi:cobalt/nickel transport system permease protein
MIYAPHPMHIPDGFLSVPVAILFWVTSLVMVSLALRRVSRDLGERQVPLMGVLAAAIFAGQMLNFSIAGGTSGHLMGAAIATILLGPWAAILVLTTVVGIQALIFQDGGLLALGANIFNMGVIGVTVSYFAYHTLRRLSGNRTWGIFLGGFLAAWLSIVVAALAAALQLALSGTSPANIAVPAMAGVHALIGIGEGLITLGALAFFNATRRDLLTATQTSTPAGSVVWIGGLIFAIGLAVLSPLASAHPDGLMWVAGQQGFLQSAQASRFRIIPGYLLPGISNHTLATILGGILGTLIVFGVALGVAFTRRSRQARHHSQDAEGE